MSGGVFFLDEERDSSPSTSPRPSPPLTVDTRSTPSPVSASSNCSTQRSSTLLPPSAQQPSLLSPQPTPLIPSLPSHRKHPAPFAATPSFPSPLAQAMTVPLNSDTSSNSSHSDHEHSEDDGDAKGQQASGAASNASGTPKKSADQLDRPRTASPVLEGSRSASPTSTQKSTSRPPSPAKPPPILTPGALLMKSKRSVSGSGLVGSLPSFPSANLRQSPPRAGPAPNVSSGAPGPRRVESIARAESATRSHFRGRSGSGGSSTVFAGLPTPPSQAGSSPLAFGSPELFPLDDDSPRPRGSISVSPSRESKDSNILGLGWGAGWDTQSASGSSFGSNSQSSRDKGKGKEVMGPPSPRKERDLSRTGSLGVSSSPRQRRPSEFLNPAFDSRKMPIVGSGRPSFGTSTVPSLSTSASMISPLNPLPSPWTSASESSAFSAPNNDQTSDSASHSTAPPPGGGAIRLNRVPTSVKLATDLIKNPNAILSPPNQPPQDKTPSTSSNSTTSVPTPNPSPVGSVPTPNTMPTHAPRELGPFASLPDTTPKMSAPATMEIGKGRPTISVPATPVPSRTVSSTDGVSPTTGATRPPESGLIPSLSTLAPPSSFKQTALLAPRVRSTLLTDTAGSAEPFATGRTHRYRTSMHEATYKPVVLQDSPASSLSWASPPETGEPSTADASATARVRPSYGLGLNMPSTTAYLAAPEGGSGSLTPGAPSARARTTVTAGKTLQMDLAGISALEDAASHASMIMQSRQAKLQRWRPNSAGSVTRGEGLLPPAFNRSTTTGAPAMLAGPRSERQAQWGLSAAETAATTATTPGEDLPPIPSSMRALGRVATVAEESTSPGVKAPTNGPPHIRSNAGPSRFAPASMMGGMGGIGMEKQSSASGMVGGIEWVDWYDCYKRYKDAKIRAEAAEAARHSRQHSPKEDSTASSLIVAVPDTRPSPIIEDEPFGRPNEMDLTAAGIEATSAIALTPSTSRDDFTIGPGSISNQLRRRSLSIRSSLSTMDPRLSPNQKRTSIFERPRQSSGSSIRSTDTSSVTAIKKKKNLVTKMEGWWNAVKSNFIPESQHPPYRPSNLGPNVTPRIPSAPTSRRGSEIPPLTTPQAALLAPAPMRRDSSQSVQSLRGATSHAELRPKQNQYDAQSIHDVPRVHGSASTDLSRLSRQSSTELAPPPPILAPPARAPSTVDEESSAYTRTSIDSRRKQPNLRLELEPHVFTRPSSQFTSNSSGSQGNKARPDLNRPSGGTSRSSSYSQPMHGPGLTPGVPRRDQTPSPIFAVDTNEREARENRPVAPGADITIASVRRHVKHRMNAAKEACDAKLTETINQITTFAEEQRREEMIEPTPPDEQAQDYFESMSDSLVDAEESEQEFVDSRSHDGYRSRNESTSRGPSRRASMTRPNGFSSSPTRHGAMLPSSPSRTRRRTSNAPRSFVDRDHVARNFSLSHSASSSRSTSRSRSPMPTSRGPLLSSTHLEDAEAVEANRKFLATLQELIVFATDVLEMSVNSLVARPSACTEIIQKLQKVGSNWDEHDDWPGRNWYVDILMAVANLSRVLDWWEAEKGFWNFDDEDENEPIVFVMKPSNAKEESRFDQDFKAALDRPDPSLKLTTLQLPEPPTAINVELSSPDTAGPLTSQTAVAPSSGTPKAQAVEDLRFLAEHAKSVNIVMELSLQGEEIQYINDAIMEVTGREPEEVLFKPITDILAPADTTTFTEATQTLLDDDNNTVQLRVRVEVHELESVDDDLRQPGPVYIELEGVGMLMREDDEPTHTMWVLKPVPATQVDDITDAAFPRNGKIVTEGILCRICEREIVTWFFEKHNETCDAVHRLEAEISECDECLGDLHQTVVKLNAEIEENSPSSPTHYQGVLFFTLPESLSNGHNDIPAGPQGVEMRKITRGHLEDVESTLAVAKQIETPSVRDDEADLPFNVQRYMDSESEERLARITRWQRPQTADRALALLFTHVEEQLRRKQKAIARMQSTIRYSEKTRHEWEDKVNQMLAERDESNLSESGSDGVPEGIASPTEPTTDPPEQSPPGHRKIAPQARLPITQGHPHRPTTAQGDPGASTTILPTPMPQSSAPPTPATVPTQKPVNPLPPPLSIPIPPSGKVDLKTPSGTPFLETAEKTHARRVSTSRAVRDAPLSPRIPSAALQPRAAQPSIKDFEIIKPISRGAFGSVYLAKKVATGDYFAIKALKKSDMIAKNQITNVKAERTILMNQASSPYVVKLFFSFQSKDYLYLVMEYLNGGDCATLVKTLGGLSEEWARNYIAEVVLGLEYLHARNVVHRDIKPDNLLIDARGHLKLTDFGLSRIGLLNRQVGGPRPAYLRGTSLRGSTRSHRPTTAHPSSVSSADSPLLSPEVLHPPPPLSSLSQSYFAGVQDSGSADDSSGSESAGIIPKHMRPMSTTKFSSNTDTPSISGREPPRFVGTPDYLAPESILGIGADDRVVDWWALGVVLYEFLYGIPPFHAETPEKVFDNVISRRINWHEDEIEISAEAHDLMDRLMCSNPQERLGSRGADEVKKHAFFAGIDWATIATAEASFVPEVTDPESTDYFDSRGAAHAFHDDDGVPQVLKPGTASAQVSPPGPRDMSAVVNDISSQEDFGTFNFKNLPVLKQANDDVIRKLRVDSMAPIGQTLESAPNIRERTRSASGKVRDRTKRKPSDIPSPNGPPSPSTSTSSAASTPSRASIPPSTPGTGTVPPMPIMPQHFRRPSELNALDRVKSSEDSDLSRRASAPTRIRAGSSSSMSDRSTSMEMWHKRRQISLHADTVATGGAATLGLIPPLDSLTGTQSLGSATHDRALDVLIAEDNPISQKILETLLTRMGCRCICVEDGPQALAATMGSIKFDVIICDIHMPVVSGEQVARMIRSTNNHNQNTPIIAATNYEQHQAITEKGTLFSAVLAKPVTKTDLIKCLAKLGFVLSSSSRATGESLSSAASFITTHTIG